jgi:hypothetical protein
MADNRRQDDSDDYGEREVKTGHIYEEADEEAEIYQEGEEEVEYQDEPDYEDAAYPDDDPERETDEGFPLDKMKEVIMALQIGLKKKDIELLQSKQQNLELLHELEKLSEQYVKDQSKEADQLSRVKQYEEEFQQIQKGNYLLSKLCKKSWLW